MKRVASISAPGFLAVLGLTLAAPPALAQQFNSDSWLSKDPGVATIILTAGQRNGTLMTSFALLPKWEFTVAGFFYNDDAERATNDGYTMSLFAKFMFLQNKAKTGGMAVKIGTGLRPEEVAAVEVGQQGAFQTFWMNVPATIPLLDNSLQIDLMPGLSFTDNLDEEVGDAWALTYSTRVAWYPWHPEWSIVGEVYGAAGDAEAIPEFKAGIRWEPNPRHVWALTYGQEFAGDGTNDAKLEFGLMLFTPPFFCFSGC